MPLKIEVRSPDAKPAGDLPPKHDDGSWIDAPDPHANSDHPLEIDIRPPSGHDHHSRY